MKVAITGIIGSGKSEVSKILREKGECVLSADEINAKLLTDSDYLKKLNKVFPEAFIDGSFDKKKLSSIVFSDEKELEKLNALAHPEIMKTIFRLASEKELVFCEIPLLRDEWVEFFDYVWIVSCDSEEKRIERICNRDGRSLEQAKQMIDSQRENRDIIYGKCSTISNNGNLDELRDCVEREYCKLTVN